MCRSATERRRTVFVCSFGHCIHDLKLMTPASEGIDMDTEHPELDQLQSDYKAAVESWISAIRNEEALASENHSLIEIDQ
jgi:hypothetical protein